MGACMFLRSGIRLVKLPILDNQLELMFSCSIYYHGDYSEWPWAIPHKISDKAIYQKGQYRYWLLLLCNSRNRYHSDIRDWRSSIQRNKAEYTGSNSLECSLRKRQFNKFNCLIYSIYHNGRIRD